MRLGQLSVFGVAKAGVVTAGALFAGGGGTGVSGNAVAGPVARPTVAKAVTTATMPTRRILIETAQYAIARSVHLPGRAPGRQALGEAPAMAERATMSTATRWPVSSDSTAAVHTAAAA